MVIDPGQIRSYAAGPSATLTYAAGVDTTTFAAPASVEIDVIAAGDKPVLGFMVFM